MIRSVADLDSIWRFCTRHRDLLARSDKAGCFHCGAIFAPADIVQWIDEPPAANSGKVTDAGVTALCPRCGIDAVLPSAVVELSPELLTQMAHHYFGGQFHPLGSEPHAG
jgi:hypothetical protein